MNGVKYTVRFEVKFVNMTGKSNAEIVDAVRKDTYGGHRIGNFLSTNYSTSRYELKDRGSATDARVDVLVDKMNADVLEGKSDGNTPVHEALHNIGGLHEDGGMLDQNSYTPRVDIDADGTRYEYNEPTVRKMTKKSIGLILERSFSEKNPSLPVVNETGK